MSCEYGIASEMGRTSGQSVESYKDRRGVQGDVVPVEIILDVPLKGVDGTGDVVARSVAGGTTSGELVERGGHGCLVVSLCNGEKGWSVVEGEEREVVLVLRRGDDLME